MEEIISKNTPRTCVDEMMKFSNRKEALSEIALSITNESLDILPVLHLILKKARKMTRDPISLEIADLLIQNDWFNWISTHQNQFSMIMKHDILVVIVDLVKEKSQNETVAIPLGQIRLLVCV